MRLIRGREPQQPVRYRSLSTVRIDGNDLWFWLDLFHVLAEPQDHLRRLHVGFRTNETNRL